MFCIDGWKYGLHSSFCYVRHLRLTNTFLLLRNLQNKYLLDGNGGVLTDKEEDVRLLLMVLSWWSVDEMVVAYYCVERHLCITDNIVCEYRIHLHWVILVFSLKYLPNDAICSRWASLTFEASLMVTRLCSIGGFTAFSVVLTKCIMQYSSAVWGLSSGVLCLSPVSDQ